MTDENQKLNLNAMRTHRANNDTSAKCLESMRALCMKEQRPDEVACCRCGTKSLVLKKQANGANPWAKIQCTYVYSDGVECGFQHPCGHAEPPPPQLKP